MRRRKKGGISPLELDSLVDIVFNNVGILVILTVFMALISLVDSSKETPEKKDEVSLATKKIVIPWSHDSQKSSLLFLIRDNRILFLDRSPIYELIKEDIISKPKPRNEYKFEDYTVELLPVSASTHCLNFKPKSKTGELWYKAKVLEKVMKSNSPSEFYFFFWVDADSFELFREVRDFLLAEKFEVGWRPVLQNSNIQFCSPAFNNLSFQPQ